MTGDNPLLPSVFERLTDDSHLLHEIKDCTGEIKHLEKCLQSLDINRTDTADSNIGTSANKKFDQESKVQKQTWLREIAQKRIHAQQLQESIGSFENIRDSVKRDLGWLLNSRSFYMEAKKGIRREVSNSHENGMVLLDAKKYPHVATSVINYGLPDLTGKTASGIEKGQLEKMMRQALIAFEPRIIPESLELSLSVEDSMQDHNVLMFDIDAMLWAEPAPVHLQIRTQLDLETGGIDLIG